MSTTSEAPVPTSGGDAEWPIDLKVGPLQAAHAVLEEIAENPAGDASQTVQELKERIEEVLGDTDSESGVRDAAYITSLFHLRQVTLQVLDDLAEIEAVELRLPLAYVAHQVGAAVSSWERTLMREATS